MASDTQDHQEDYQLYNKTAADYDNTRFKGKAGDWGHQRQLKVLRNMVEDWKGKKVLEIGCGTGRITEALVSWGANVTATDISQEMIDVAKTRFTDPHNIIQPEFQLLSIFEKNLDFSAFDSIIMINVLGRLSEPEVAINNIAASMSDGSTFIFSFPNLSSVLLPFGLLVNARGKSIGREVTSHWYMPSAIEKFCNNADLQVLQYYGNHYIPVPRLLFWTLPFFWLVEKLIAKPFPKHCASVFAKCTRK